MDLYGGPDWQIPAVLRNFGSVSQGVYVRKGSEMPQTASAAGRQKYPRGHGPDRATKRH